MFLPSAFEVFDDETGLFWKMLPVRSTYESVIATFEHYWLRTIKQGIWATYRKDGPTLNKF